MQFGLRLGDWPPTPATTTPAAIPLLKRLLAEPGTKVTRMRTDENARNLAGSFLTAVVARYRGTVLGRQELDGELIEDRPDALWTRAMFRPGGSEPTTRTVVAVDPPVTGGAKSDACGIVVAGRTETGALVLADRTLKPAPPLAWARRAVEAYRAHAADLIVAEANQGGELVREMSRQVEAAVPIRRVHATRGKWVRAEPVAALYAEGRVSHVGRFDLLEDQLCALGTDGLARGKSPDRLDALVWALTDLMLEPPLRPQLRSL